MRKFLFLTAYMFVFLTGIVLVGIGGLLAVGSAMHGNFLITFFAFVAACALAAGWFMLIEFLVEQSI